MTTREPFGARLKRLREQLPTRTGQQTVADAVGIARSTLGGIEAGHAMPGRETMVALADYFGVSIDYLESGAQPAGRDLPADLPQQIDAREFIGAWEFLDEDQRRRLAQTLLDMLRANGKPAGHAERLLRSANRK